jgi:hypothetical protein
MWLALDGIGLSSPFLLALSLAHRIGAVEAKRVRAAWAWGGRLTAG